MIPDDAIGDVIGLLHIAFDDETECSAASFLSVENKSPLVIGGHPGESFYVIFQRLDSTAEDPVDRFCQFVRRTEARVIRLSELHRMQAPFGRSPSPGISRGLLIKRCINDPKPLLA